MTVRATAEPTVRVVLEIDEALRRLVDAARLERGELAHELGDLFAYMGMPGRPLVKVEPVPSRRAVRVRVHGALQPYDPRLARQVWLSHGPAHARDAALLFEHEPGSGSPDGWLREHAGDAADPASLSAFVRRLVVEVVARRASCVVGARQVAVYAASMRRGRQVPTGALTEVLRTLLDFGISVANRPAVVHAVHEGAGREPADTAETLIARLRPRRIELHAHPRTLATLLAARESRSRSITVYAKALSEDVREPFEETEEFVYLDSGLRLPDIFWVPSEQMYEEAIAVRINDLVGPGLPLPPEGKLLVNAPPSSLVGLAAEPALGPDGPCALIDEQASGRASERGYAALDRLAFVRHFLFKEVAYNAPRLLSVRDVELELYRMDAPELIEATLERVSIADLTRVLRGLLDGGLSIRNMHTVLERLLRFDIVDADGAAYVVFDDRLPLRGELPATPCARARTLARYVREGMAGFISSRFSFGTTTLVAYLLEPEFERLALEAAPDDLEAVVDRPEVEATLEALRAEVWRELSYLPPAAAKPVLLTSAAARDAVRRVLAPELPEHRVVRRTEVLPEINVMPMARIAAPAGAPLHEGAVGERESV